MKENKFQIEAADAYKKAALVLHSLDPKDKQWVLNHLPETQSEQLSALLIELETIGITFDDEALLDVLKETSPNLNHEHFQESSESDYSEKCKKINHFSQARVSQLLTNESDEVIALALAVDNWQWAAKFLSSLPLSRRDAIRKQLKAYLGSLSQAMKNSIVDYFIQAIPASVDEPVGEPA